MKHRGKRYKTRHPMFRVPRNTDYVGWEVLRTVLEVIDHGRV